MTGIPGAPTTRELQLPTVVSNNVHFAGTDERWHADAVAAIRAHRSVEDLEGWLPAARTAYLRSGPSSCGRSSTGTRARSPAPRCSASNAHSTSHFVDFTPHANPVAGVLR
ncbi:hypothetical protein AB0J55_00570 [Amycolatopsis sp. NPDC049688]|uniref:hypothetical protein n=1 Tax=Amycolatopsis sp. NPDC049688 TaxID=3154733 RepID=UPI00341ADBBB